HRLALDEYTEVLYILDRDDSLRGYIEDKVRYDYDPYYSCLTIRILSPLYNVFCTKIVEEILREDPSASFANKVVYLATSRIMIPNKIRDRKQSYSKRELDISFKHRRARYLADEYILNTDRSVNAVITLDIDYKGSKKATITAIAVVEALLFRIDSGLLVKDFATEDLSREYIRLDREFTIISRQLYDFLLYAEEEQRA
ncbi:hypothetical protein N7501_010590, partial [Penicillium viridicatum]